MMNVYLLSVNKINEQISLKLFFPAMADHLKSNLRVHHLIIENNYPLKLKIEIKLYKCQLIKSLIPINFLQEIKQI